MELDEQNIEGDLAADLLRGVPKIARFIGETERRTFYMVEKGMIPAGKVGSNWIASKAALRRHYARITGADVSDQAA